MINKLSETEENELDYKLNAIKEFLIINDGLNYKVYNHSCPHFNEEPDSNIVEYLDDVVYLINEMIKN